MPGTGRRFSVTAGFYRTCVLDGILEHSPAEHVRRPSVPAESPTPGFTHLQSEALLTAARQSPNPYDFALVAMPGLLGLRIFEATGADIADLGEEHGHRVLRVCGKGTKIVLVPLPPAVGRAIDQAAGSRPRGSLLLNRRGTRMDRHAATRRLHQLAGTAGIQVAKAHPHMLRHTFVTTMQRRGVASDATSRHRRKDDGVGDPAGALSPPLTASTQETTDQGWSVRTRLHQMQRRGIQFRCVRCQHVASSSTLKQQRRGQMRYLAVGRAEVFSVVGKPLPTSFDAGVDLRDVQIAARHADPRTTMRYDRARQNLDRHPNYILAAFMASGT